MAGAGVGWLWGIGGVVGTSPCPRTPAMPLHPTDGAWETAESCVVGTSASIYRRLQDSPERPRGAVVSSWGPPPRPALASSSPPASEQLPRCESEDSGVEMPSNEHSPLTPLGSHSSFSLSQSLLPGGEPGTDPSRPHHGRSGSKKLVQAAQRSRRQRAPGRCPRQLGRHGASTAKLWAQLARESREREEPEVENPDGAVRDGEGEAVAGGGGRDRPAGSHAVPTHPQAVPEVTVPVPGQGLQYLEHVCQLLEHLARLQQDNLLLRQQVAQAGHSHPDTMPTQDPVWRGERFRPRSCSDSQAPAPAPGPCRRTWGHSASSPSLLDPCESGGGTPTADKDGRWGRVKLLLTRLTRRSLRGGRCR
ncbi:uncharacterized protein C8orf58 homolog [Indicator indicator]|uniref:uncharacterized protein C8orf58 homolog n=1 Tax=Indicator indicator TaxID=1002788 RepID=UPI0023E039FF|nr:uncharacterized protein C8orf58 homolog [Indicator indicator]